MAELRTELVMSALGAAAQLAMSHHGQKHEQAMLSLRSGALMQITDALVTRRVSAVQEGFREVLGQYAEDARALRAQQAEFGTAQIHASDPLMRVELSKRVRDIDAELGRIRADAMLLYGRMTEVILLLGGAALDLGPELSGQLALPMHTVGAHG